MKLQIIAYNPNFVSPEVLQKFVEDMTKQGISVQTIAHVQNTAAPVYSVNFISLREPSQVSQVIPPFGKPGR